MGSRCLILLASAAAAPCDIYAAMYGLILLASAAAAPCDIYAAGGTPCVAAHSMVRHLYDAYAGPLYRVRRGADNATLDVGVGGVARQDEFCARSLCRVARIFDQSSRENDLVVGIAGSSGGRRPDAGVVANRSLASAAGRPAYAAVFEGGEGYRTSGATGVATGDAPETVYAVLSGAYYNDACCFDYGNAYPDARDHGAGTMEAIYFGNKTKEKWSRGAGAGPWVQADLESGLWAGNESVNERNVPVTSRFVTAVLKGRRGGFVLKAGDATRGALRTLYDGARPAGYEPMSLGGAVVLGTGGDNSNGGVGAFYEGAITAGFASDETDAAVQADVVAAGYA